MNFGVTGYSFQQSLEALRLRVFAWDPDLILFAYCLNDPQEYSLEFEHLLVEMTDTERSHRALRSAAEHSRLFALVRYLMSVREGERKRKVEDGDDPQFRAAHEGTLADYVRSLHASERTWAPVASGLEELESITEARDVPAHFVVFPLLDDFDDYQLADTHAFLATSFSQRSFATLDLLVPLSIFATHVDRRVGFDSLTHAFVAVAILRQLLQTQALPTLGGSDFSKLLEGHEPESGYAKLLEP